MDSVKELFATAPFVAWSVVSVVLAGMVIALNWPRMRWWWHNTWYSMPLIGKIASLSKDPNRDPLDTAWFKAEKTLSRDYKQFIRIQDEHDFNEKIAYLKKAGDLGRRNTPALIWVLTVALVFVEAMGFAYVLAGYTLPGASENLQQTGAYGIAFLLSVILVGFTHFAGHELYRSSKIKHARQEWVEGGRQGKTMTGEIALAEPQTKDDAEPGYVQLMNRVGTLPAYYLTIATIVIVVVVAIGATYVRGQVLEKQLQQQVTGQNSSINVSITASGDSLNMSASQSGKSIALPAEDAAANRAAEQKAIQDEVSIDRHGGWGTFIILAFIFVFLQMLGVFFGFRWGFAGKESGSAFAAVGAGRYATYSDVREHYKDIADAAQSKLEHLQQRLMERNSISGNDGLHASKTFYDFMNAERDRELRDRQKEMQRTSQRTAMENAPAVTPAEPLNAAPASVVVSTPTAPAVAVSIATAAVDNAALEASLQILHAMGDNKEGKKVYIQTLSEDLQVQVMQALKAQKEQAARLASQRNAELDDLL